MAANHPQSPGAAFLGEPKDLLPEDSVLSFEEYLAMYVAVGHRARYEILYRLIHSGDTRPTELADAIDIDDSTLHYHSTNSSTSGSSKNANTPSEKQTASTRTTERQCSAR